MAVDRPENQMVVPEQCGKALCYWSDLVQQPHVSHRARPRCLEQEIRQQERMMLASPPKRQSRAQYLDVACEAVEELPLTHLAQVLEVLKSVAAHQRRAEYLVLLLAPRSPVPPDPLHSR